MSRSIVTQTLPWKNCFYSKQKYQIHLFIKIRIVVPETNKFVDIFDMLDKTLALQLYLHSSKIYENCVRHFPLNSYTWNWLNNEIGFLIMYASNVRFPLSQADLIFDMNYLPWQKSISILRLSYVKWMVTNKSIFFADISISSPIFCLN